MTRRRRKSSAATVPPSDTASTAVAADPTPESQAHWRVLHEVVDELERQREKWGEQNHPNGTGDGASALDAVLARNRCDHAFRHGAGSWRLILEEEVAETFAAGDDADVRAELVQVAAVAVSWIEAVDRRARS